jgi:uncharacterized protein YerC
VISYVKKVGITTRKLLLNQFYRDIDTNTLNEIEMTMQRMGVVKVKLLMSDGDKQYEWIGGE